MGIALFGGSVLHGLGHWYAGHKNIFWILLSTEIVPPIIILITAFTSPSDNSIIYNTFNNIYPTLFVGTWAYDIIGAPIMCIRDNKRKNKNMIMVQPYIQNDLFANKIFIRFSYSF